MQLKLRSGRVLVYGKHRRKSVEVGTRLNEIHSLDVRRTRLSIMV